MSQYTLELALPAVYSADTFIVSGSNRTAWDWVQRWPDWPAGAKTLLLYGPGGSGKSHLGHIWAARANAGTIAATALGQEPSAGNWLIEDIETVADQRQLLHWFNYIREQGGSLLITAPLPAQSLSFTLPDLTSRLLAVPSAGLGEPDDEVLAGAIRKQFSDRQMKVEDDVIAYLLPRMERSLAEAQKLVAMLDAQALAESRTITIPFVKKVLDHLSQE